MGYCHRSSPGHMPALQVEVETGTLGRSPEEREGVLETEGVIIRRKRGESARQTKNGSYPVASATSAGIG